ncbi:MAG: trypsin, partial [Paraglaciecola sp.]
YSIELSAGENLITWVYSKDLNTSAGDDKGFIQNVSFTPVDTETSTPITTTSSSSGGGSMAWLTLMMLGSLMGRFGLQKMHK